MNKNAALSLRAPLSSRAEVRSAVPQSKRLPANSTPLRAVLSPARVVPIYWDKHFQRTPSDVVAFNEFLRILFESTFMSALGPHGVRSAELLSAFVPHDEAPTRLTRARLEAQLCEWLGSEQITPQPKKLETGLLFLVLTPLGSLASLGAAANARTFGYHESIAFARPSLDTRAKVATKNLHYVAVPLITTGSQILEVHSRAVSQQLGRAFLARVRSVAR